MLKDVSGGRDQKRLFLFLTLLAVSETWLSLTLLAALIGVPQRQLGSILQKIEGTIIFLDDDHYHFSHSLTREYLLDTQQPYCLEENDKVKARQLLYRIAHFSFAILIVLPPPGR
jgi:transcriptional antiterminator